MTPSTEQKHSAELKPCPFCGGEAIIGGGGSWGVNCTQCQCSVGLDFDQEAGDWLGTFKTKEEAVEQWNRRAPVHSDLLEKALDQEELHLTWKAFRFAQREMRDFQKMVDDDPGGKFASDHRICVQDYKRIAEFHQARIREIIATL